MKLDLIAKIHERIEEIIQRIAATDPSPLSAYFQHCYLKHRNCKPISYHFTIGQNDRDGEVIMFDRFCGCHGGLLALVLKRTEFEDDSALQRWISETAQRQSKESSEDRERRYQQYLQLCKEFQTKETK